MLCRPGLNGKEMLSSFTTATPACKKRQHVPLNCTLVPREGTGVVHHFGFSAAYIHLEKNQCPLVIFLDILHFMFVTTIRKSSEKA
jgi:hypothetical protein